MATGTTQITVKLLSKSSVEELGHFSRTIFYLQNARKRKWRDPDSNRGHHDFQLGNENVRRCC